MRHSVVRSFPPGNGNAPAAAATAPATGLDVGDAAYHTAHDFPGGVPALAQRMGMSQHTLAHKVCLHNATHHLSLREAVRMQGVAGDVRILHAMAAALGHVCISMHVQPGGSTLEDITRMAGEFADVMRATTDAVADGRVTVNEMHECERQAAELAASVNTMLGTLRAMMPPPPAGAVS